MLVSKTETIDSIDENGALTTMQHERKLLYQIFSNCHAETELVQNISTNIAADAQSFLRNSHAKDCSLHIQKILSSTVYAAKAFYDALAATTKKLAIEAIFEESQRSQAAIAVEEEFKRATGPAQNNIVNQATKKLISEKTSLHQEEISSLKKLLKNSSSGTENGAASKKKSATKKKLKKQGSKAKTAKAKAEKAAQLAEKARKEAKKALKALKGKKGKGKAKGKSKDFRGGGKK